MENWTLADLVNHEQRCVSLGSVGYRGSRTFYMNPHAYWRTIILFHLFIKANKITRVWRMTSSIFVQNDRLASSLAGLYQGISYCNVRPRFIPHVSNPYVYLCLYINAYDFSRSESESISWADHSGHGAFNTRARAEHYHISLCIYCQYQFFTCVYNKYAFKWSNV